MTIEQEAAKSLIAQAMAATTYGEMEILLQSASRLIEISPAMMKVLTDQWTKKQLENMKKERYPRQ